MLMCATNAADQITQEIAVFPGPVPTSCPEFKYFNPLPINIYSYVNIPLFSSFLGSHPNRFLVKYVLEGLEHGFDIGFEGTNHMTQPKNLLSAKQNKVVLNEAISKEISRGHTSGPFINPPLNNLHCSPIGSVVKKGKTCRLIMDLSQPRGYSINENISKDDYSVQYTHFDAATALVREAGSLCLLSKADVKHAFRLLPIKPSVGILLGRILFCGYPVTLRTSFIASNF